MILLVARNCRTSLDPTDEIRGPHFSFCIQTSGWQNPTSALENSPDPSELLKSTFCGMTATIERQADSKFSQYNTWWELLQATAQELYGVVANDVCVSTNYYGQAILLRRAQQRSYTEEFCLLKVAKQIQRSSHLYNFSPELDATGELIRVGGRLRRFGLHQPAPSGTRPLPSGDLPAHTVLRQSPETSWTRECLCSDLTVILGPVRPGGSAPIPKNLY